MNQIAFSLQNVWKQMRHNKFGNALIFTMVLIGLFFPLMAQNDINDLLAESRMSTRYAPEGITVIDFEMKYKEEVEMEKVLAQGFEEGLYNQAGYSAYRRQIIYVGEDSYAAAVSGISRDYLALNACELLDGELFSAGDYVETGSKICLLEQQSYLVGNGFRTGDYIELRGELYLIKGIIHAPRIYGGIVIPYQMSPELFSDSNSSIQYQLITCGNNDMIPSRLASYLFSEDEHVFSALTGTEAEQIYQESIRKVNHYRTYRSELIVVFASICLTILIYGKIVHEKYYLAVRMAIGADEMTVRREVIVNHVILLILAFIIDLILYPHVTINIDGSNRYLYIKTILQVLSVSILIITVTSSISFRIGMAHQSIALMLKKK